ncbi:MAG: sugar phosphate isomerase/epimerase [Eubacteriales bacterium]|nr:sugar phosphate isomerase/epimerase [Eubacteriales bacterium]MDD3880704.1 sugar phosphate isomerase/epimerase [Eubacteriales bacterium]MDD4511662.1 sugar phosphate isomerase/epimerase [Eubacteriales bacterium]
MKLSFSTLGCPRWTWREIVSTAHDLGYDGIEVRGVGKDISVPSVPEFSEANWKKTAASLEKLGLEIPCLSSDLCIHVRESAEHTHREAAAYCALAKRMNVKYIRIMGTAAVPQPMGRVDEAFVRDEAALLSEIAAENGVTLLIETNGVWASSERLARLIDDVGSENVQALWDVHHPYRFMGEKPQDTIANLGKHIRHVHMKDSVWDGDKIHYAMMGYGDIPCLEIAGLLSDSGYEGFYSLEWVKRWDDTLEEPGIVFAHYASYMRSL